MIAKRFHARLVLALIAVGCGDDRVINNDRIDPPPATQPAPSAQPERPPAEPVAQPGDQVAPDVRAPAGRAAPAMEKNTGPALSTPGCLKLSKKLIKEGKGCRLSMDKYTPEGICSRYQTEDKFTDEQMVKRLHVFLDGGCSTLKAAVDGDRI